MSTFAFRFAGRDLQSYTVMDFSGGIDLKTSSFKNDIRKDNKYLRRAENVVLSNDGVVARRPPFVRVNTSSTWTGAGSGKPILGGYHYRKSDGTSQVLVAWNTNLYNCGTDGTSAPSSIKSGLTAGASYSFATYNDICIIANGVDQPMQYDGTTVSNLSGSSPATMSYVVTHANRLFALATAVPSRLYWSKLNNPTDWSGTDDAGFMDVDPNDGSTISTLVSSIQELVILKGSKPYRLQGIGPTTGYTVVDHLMPASGSRGTTYRRGATFAQNDVYYVSSVGLHKLSATQQFGDLKEAFPSEPIEPVFDGTASSGLAPFTASSIDWTPSSVLSTPQALYDPGTQAIYVGIHDTTGLVDTVGMTDLLVYDIYTKGWTFWTPPGVDIACMWPYVDTDGQHRVMFGCTRAGSAGGCVLMLDPLDTGDDENDASTSVDITAVVQHSSDLGAINVVKSPRYLTLYNTSTGSNPTADYVVACDGTSTNTGSVTITALGARLNLSGICSTLDVRLTDTANSFRWAGYRVDWRERRRIRQP